MSNITEHTQGSSLGNRVQLFEIDLSRFGEANLYLTPAAEEGVSTVVTFDTVDYTPHPVKLQGVTTSIEGSLPRPTIMLGNVGRPFKALLAAHDDFRGAVVTRYRTFEKFLDGKPDADPNALLPVDKFRVLRKTVDTRTTLQFELAAFMDVSKADLPGEVVMRDFCPLIYRRYVDGAFVYDTSDQACPFADEGPGDFFDENDVAATAGEDKCSKLLSGCKVRFGANAVLPFGGFPGVARLRSRN